MAIAQTQPLRTTSVVASKAQGRKRRLDPEIGRNVRAMRERIGWLQAEFGEAAEVATGTWGGLESGRTTRADRLERIARALGVTTEELRTGAIPDPAARYRDLSDEDLRIARQFHHADTDTRVSVAYALRK